MFGRCAQQIAIDWIQLIIASLGSGDVTNFLGSIAFLVAIASKLVGLGFAGPKGSAMIRSVVVLAGAIWLAHIATMQRTLIEHTVNEVKKCIQDVLPSFPPTPVSGVLGGLAQKQ